MSRCYVFQSLKTAVKRSATVTFSFLTCQCISNYISHTIDHIAMYDLFTLSSLPIITKPRAYDEPVIASQVPALIPAASAPSAAPHLTIAARPGLPLTTVAVAPTSTASAAAAAATPVLGCGRNKEGCDMF